MNVLGDIEHGLTLFVCPDCETVKADSGQMPVHSKYCGGEFEAVEYVPHSQLEGAVEAGDALADAVRALDSYAALGGAPMERTERADAALRAWTAVRGR